VLLYRGGWRAEALTVAGVCVCYLGYNSGYYLPFGGGTPGPRFLTTMLPFLAEDPPVPWRSARDWNRGPAAGPPVVPGTYGVSLTTDASTLQTGVRVDPDPRADWSASDYAAKYCIERELDDELSVIDTKLNEMDARRLQNTALYRALTSRPVNSEDDLWLPDRLRERITILQSSLGLSQGPPTLAHLREAAALRAQYTAALHMQPQACNPM